MISVLLLRKKLIIVVKFLMLKRPYLLLHLLKWKWRDMLISIDIMIWLTKLNL